MHFSANLLLYFRELFNFHNRNAMNTVTVLWTLSCFVSLTAHGKQVAIKIVEEPTSYGWNAGVQNVEESPSLQMRISPSNFSGPPHLKRLQGNCYSKILESYKYELCPFANVTQHEQSLRWNPYSGILGVWQEWEIENNTFVAMVMGEGDSCGSLYRSTKVLFQCGERNEIVEMSEPSTCNYQLVFSSPLVCHPHSLLVYPTLSHVLQREWDHIEGQLVAEEVTRQGYRKLLHHLFEKADYMLPAETKNKLARLAKEKEEIAGKVHEDRFDSLTQCQAEYNKLKIDIDALRTVLKVNGLPDEIPEQPKEVEPPHEMDEHNPYKDYQWMHDRDEYEDL